MNREVEVRRQRASAAWRLIQADVVRLKEAMRDEVAHVQKIGREIGPRSILQRFPLTVAGIAATTGFFVGVRGGRHRATLARMAETQMGGGSREKTLGRRIVEALVLAAVQRGASALAASAAKRLPEPEAPREEPRRQNTIEIVGLSGS